MHPILKNQLKQGKLHHSYLLIGDELACQDEISQLINALAINQADLIDLSQNEAITIAQARELIRLISLTPHSSAYKVVILPGERLGPEAAQALLKSIEEPPSHSLWLLYTVNEKKLPATIVSRCQRLYIGKFKLHQDIVELKKIMAMPVSKRFELAKQLVEAGKAPQALDQWLAEVHNGGLAAPAIKRLNQLLEIKKRLATNTNATLQLEAFFYNL